VEYSLRNAVLRIYGPVNRTIQSEDYLGATEIAVELPAGEYLLRLDGNWTLEAPGGAAVNAALRSQNPLPFTIQDQVVTGLQIRFAVGEDVVALGNGQAVVSIAVDDTSPENTAASCSDGVDNDGDSFVDCTDFDCQGAGFCGSENTAALCSDGVDNDNDTFVDCDDFDCQGAGFCDNVEDTAATCSDGVDNDSDSFVDCDDFDCQNAGFCGTTENTQAACNAASTKRAATRSSSSSTRSAR
jgi:hypothetical protein